MPQECVRIAGRRGSAPVTDLTITRNGVGLRGPARGIELYNTIRGAVQQKRAAVAGDGSAKTDNTTSRDAERLRVGISRDAENRGLVIERGRLSCANEPQRPKECQRSER